MFSGINYEIVILHVWRFMIFALQKIFCHFFYPDFQNLFNIEKDISLTAL